MIYPLTKGNFDAQLRSQLRALGTQKAMAEHLGISPQYLNDLLNGRRKPSDRMLAHFGLRWEIVKA